MATTMYDTPMHDFSQENTMDADMLPSAVSDADWLQVENMMEDGDSQKPLAQEVDMSHDDVQEFEMRDADTELGGDFGQALSEHSRTPFRPEPQDQEIPDASRAPSPGAAVEILQQAPSELPKSVSSDPESDHALRHSSADAELVGDATQVTQDSSETDHDNEFEAKNETTINPENAANDRIPSGDVGNISAADFQDNSTISGESTCSPQLQSQQEQQVPELPEQAEAPVTSAYNDETELKAIDSQAQDVETVTGNQAAEADEDGLLIDPPPSVLLFYPFDNSNFALFNLPETSLPPEVTVNSAPEASTTTIVVQESSHKQEASGGYPATSATDRGGAEDFVLLFRERFALYYEPLSLVFEALRADNDFNVEGRFDDNVELMISAPELDLNLPEDNIHTREVSLHDLSVLHSGCELSGPMSLRLDTVSPRFGTRYKAIRDEVFRVVSQQEEQEEHNPSAPEEDYVVDSPLQIPSGNHVRDETPLPQTKSELAHPEADVEPGESHHEGSAPRHTEGQDVSYVDDLSESHKGEELQEGVHLEDSNSTEYIVSRIYDQDEAERQNVEESFAEDEESFDENYDGGDALYDGFEDPEQHTYEVQSSQEEHQEITSLDEPGAALNTTEEAPESFDESADVFDDGQVSVKGDPTNYLTPGHTVLVDSPESNSGATSIPRAQTPDLRENFVDATSHEYDSNAKGSSDTGRSPVAEQYHSKYGTPPPSDSRNGQDELIAYEDAVDDDDEQSQIFQTNIHEADAGVTATAPKRSHDELEDQVDGADISHDDSTESKRLRSR